MIVGLALGAWVAFSTLVCLIPQLMGSIQVRAMMSVMPINTTKGTWVVGLQLRIITFFGRFRWIFICGVQVAFGIHRRIGLVATLRRWLVIRLILPFVIILLFIRLCFMGCWLGRGLVLLIIHLPMPKRGLLNNHRGRH